MNRLAVPAGAFAALLLSWPLQAQPLDPAPCGDANGGQIVGLLSYPMGEAAPREGRRLSLSQGSTVLCLAEWDGGNGFRFRGVRPGTYEVLFAQPGMMGSPVAVEVELGVEAEVRVDAEFIDVIVGCKRWMTRCDEVLALPAPASLSEAESEEFRFWQVALALAGAAAGGTESWVACLGPYPSSELRSALFAVHRNFAPAEECGVPVSGYGVATHGATGRAARIVTMNVRGEGAARVLQFANVQATRDRYAFACPLTGVGREVQLGRCVPD